MTAAVTVQRKSHDFIYLQISFKTIFFKMLRTDTEVLGKWLIPFNILQPLITYSVEAKVLIFR